MATREWGLELNRKLGESRRRVGGGAGSQGRVWGALSGGECGVAQQTQGRAGSRESGRRGDPLRQVTCRPFESGGERQQPPFVS